MPSWILDDDDKKSESESATIPNIIESNTRDYIPMPRRLSLRSIEREGIGYRDGYATLEALFAPEASPGRILFPMIDVRVHHLYNDQYAFNVGLLTRYIPKTLCQIFGFNIYYDYRQGELGNYQRLGVGGEILGERWDFRINGYIGGQRHSHKCVFDQFVGGFYAIFREKEYSFQGFNAEIGSFLVKSRSNKFLLYAAAGPYYLSGQDDGRAWGGRIRVRPQYKDYLSLELSSSYDHIFKTIFQGEVIFNLPLYKFSKKNKKASTCASSRQIYQPVERFEIIPLKGHCGWEKNW